MNDFQLIFFIIFIVGTAALASSSLQVEDGGLPSGEKMATSDALKEVEGDEQGEAGFGGVSNSKQTPSKTEKTRPEIIRDIMKKDEQRLKYISSRVESAKSENSKDQPPKLTGLKVVKDEH